MADAHQAGAMPPLVDLPGAAPHLVVVHLVGEAVVAEHQAGVEMVVEQLMEVMEVGQLMVVTAHEPLMAVQQHMEALLHMEEAQPTVEMTVLALPTEDSMQTREIVRLPGAAHPTIRQRPEVCPLLHLGLILRHLLGATLLLRLQPMERTRRQHLAVHQWMLQLQETSQHPPLETQVISTEQHQQLRRRQALGSQLRQHPVVRIPVTIEPRLYDK